MLEALADLGVAEWVRTSRWGYAWINAAHLMGVAMLVGGVLPLDLKLLGAFPSAPREALAGVLVATAATGLALAVIAGLLLFLAGPADYAGAPLFWIKMALVAAGGGAALAFRRAAARADTPPARLRLIGAVSLACWVPALVAGRMLGYVID